MNKLKIVFITDGNHKIGMGHVYRSLNLAKTLQKRNHNIVFMTKENFSKKIISKTNTCKLYKKIKNTSVINFLKTFSPDIFIIDKLNETKSSLKTLQKFCPVIAIDYTGTNKEMINFGINILYHKTGVQRNSLSDFNYAILNEKFHKKKRKKIGKQIKSVIVLQGGADTYCFTPKIVKALNKLENNFKLIIVLGSSFKCWSKLNSVLRQCDKPVKIYHDTQDIASLMLKADLAVTAGGNTLLELAYLGIPSIVVCAEKFEIETAKLMEKKNFGINVGFGKAISTSIIQSNLYNIINNYGLRKRMNKIGPKLVDGNGAQRITQIIESKYSC